MKNLATYAPMKLSQKEDYQFAMDFDNCYAVTLKFKKVYHGKREYQLMAYEDLCKYLRKKVIDFDLHEEHTETNYHLHGIMVFPGYQKDINNFRRWFNRYFGTVHFSDKTDYGNWWEYVNKGEINNEPKPIGYMFGDADDDEVQE